MMMHDTIQIMHLLAYLLDNAKGIGRIFPIFQFLPFLKLVTSLRVLRVLSVQVQGIINTYTSKSVN